MENRKKIPSARRRRPTYPKLQLWQAVLVARPECGTNKPIKVHLSKKALPVLRGVFIFSRLQLRPSRSRHVPHVGKKERVRKAGAQ